MNPSLRRKLDQIAERHQEVTALLADPAIQADQGRFRDLTREYAQLEPVVACIQEFDALEGRLAAARELLDDQRWPNWPERRSTRPRGG